MCFSEAGELEPKDHEQEKVEDTKETPELKETARRVEAATLKPVELVEKDRDFKEAEALRRLPQRVEAQVAIVDKAVEAAAAVVEAPTGKDAKPEPDSGPESDTKPALKIK